MLRYFAGAAALALLAASPAAAQSCAQNLRTSGVPLLTGLTYSTWAVFPKVAPARALDNVGRALSAEGIDVVSVDKRAGVLIADQDGANNGRRQTVRVTARKTGNSTRVDLQFHVQAGQIATEDALRSHICRVVNTAGR
ncbi:hypothetical protein J8I29_19480 [Labrys sp. LIt4]|uniref:hypothetical protein n=1 Tax=Labrys sp. LIt4 TaxID=2821355 RepID=UPI001ADF5921|nr:hypothetical protein [Labrys sp. LIt4]MBP0581519.1 hypothetical protein [Labrys sp. LIt4]